MKIPWTELGASIGTILGIINLWFLIRDRKQHITIDRVDKYSLDFQITNRTKRPIPIQSIVLRFHEQMSNLKWKDVDSVPDTGDFKIPGILSPETSIPFHGSIRDIAAFVAYKKVRVVVKTQTGTEIKRTFKRTDKKRTKK